MTTRTFSAPNGLTASGPVTVSGTATATLFVGDLTGTASTATKLATGRTIALAGDMTGSAVFDGSTNATITSALVASGVTAGTYTKVIVDAKGRVTAGLGLTSGDVTGALGFTPTSAANAVTSVAGRTGAVTLAVADVANAVPTTSPTINGIVYLNAVSAAQGGRMILRGNSATADVAMEVVDGYFRVSRASDSTNRLQFNCNAGNLLVANNLTTGTAVTATGNIQAYGNIISLNGAMIARSAGNRCLKFENSDSSAVGWVIHSAAENTIRITPNINENDSNAVVVDNSGNLMVAGTMRFDHLRFASAPDSGWSHVSEGAMSMLLGGTTRYSVSSTAHSFNFGSTNQYRLALQADRNVVLWQNTTALWSTNTATSDLRLKTAIQSLDDGLSVINKLRPVTFQWRHGSVLDDGGKTHTGFIAQEVAPLVPDAVKQIGDTHLLHKEELVTHLVRAAQQLSAEIATVNARIDALEKSRTPRA